MLVNLKAEINSTIVRDFEVGSSDAWDDPLLETCFCDNQFVREFLRGNKEFLIGYKGAGKSAIFRLVRDEVQVFHNPKELKQIIIPIYQRMEYSSFRNLLLKKYRSEIQSNEEAMYFFWEVYCLFRIIKVLEADFQEIFRSLAKDSKDFLSYFEKKKVGFIDFLKGLKGTIGVKLDVTNPHVIIPDFYLSTESAAAKHEIDETCPFIKMEAIKADICKQLRRYNSVVYVLVDNLDDFASREEFDAQREIIQGLVETCKYYTRFHEIKIKASLRPELYEKLNFSNLGGRDKVEPRTVHIAWSAEDVRQFVGLRMYNIIVENCVENGKELEFKYKKEDSYKYRNKFSFSWLWMKLKGRNVDLRKALESNLNDKVWRDLITCVFPRKVEHFNSDGELVEGDLFEFLATHFCFAGNNATPRIYLRFLELVFKVTNETYSRNEPHEVPLDANEEFPLIMRQFITAAYERLQQEVLQNSLDSISYKPWKILLSRLFEKRNSNKEVSFQNLKSWTEANKNSELLEFLAYCNHLGILSCVNKNIPAEQRMYEFPILFQKPNKTSMRSGSIN